MGENHDIEPIAVVGMSGRFPGAGSVAEFWENLCAGRESVSVFADDVLLANGVRPDELADPAYVRARAILEDAEWFDAGLFGFAWFFGTYLLWIPLSIATNRVSFPFYFPPFEATIKQILLRE